jgi:hypothetical protein
MLERLESDLYASPGSESDLRAVKTINLQRSLRNNAIKKRVIRELEALAVFSQPTVGCSRFS